MSPSFPLVEQGILVVEGTEGIAPAVILEAAHRGATVLFTARPDCEASAEQLLTQAKAAGLAERVSYFAANAVDEDSVEQLMDTAMERIPGLNAVIHNLEPVAGWMSRGLADLSLKEWDSVMSKELRVPFLVARRAVEEFLFNRVKGRIVFVAYSGSDQVTLPANYATAQAGLRALVRCVTKEFGRREVGCNAVVIHSAGANSYHAPTAPAQSLPLDKSPLELVETVLFFATGESAFVNGEFLDISSSWRNLPLSDLGGVRGNAKG